MTKNPINSSNTAFGGTAQNSPCMECLQNLYLMVDGEATEDQSEFFKSHFEACIPCYTSFNMEKSVKEFIQNKIENRPVPKALLETIKNKIGLAV